MGNSRTGLNGQKISDSGESLFSTLCEKFSRECTFPYRNFHYLLGLCKSTLKFEGDHRINESNVSQAFHENMIIWMYFWQARDKSKYWYKICYQVGFWWNFQETFLSSMLWICHFVRRRVGVLTQQLPATEGKSHWFFCAHFLVSFPLSTGY